MPVTTNSATILMRRKKSSTLSGLARAVLAFAVSRRVSAPVAGGILIRPADRRQVAPLFPGRRQPAGDRSGRSRFMAQPEDTTASTEEAAPHTSHPPLISISSGMTDQETDFDNWNLER
jgi:hypothetical protein